MREHVDTMLSSDSGRWVRHARRNLTMLRSCLRWNGTRRDCIRASMWVPCDSKRFDWIVASPFRLANESNSTRADSTRIRESPLWISAMPHRSSLGLLSYSINPKLYRGSYIHLRLQGKVLLHSIRSGCCSQLDSRLLEREKIGNRMLSTHRRWWFLQKLPMKRVLRIFID